MILRERLKSLLKNLKYIKQERGAVFVLTAILLPVLFGCLGIGYDVGNIYMHKARLQNVADAAALAGGRAYLESQEKTTGPIDNIDENDAGHNSDNPFTYTIAGRSNRSVDGITYNSRKHADADKAADDYIYNNMINLGETVYADKYSHYAMKGKKRSGTGEDQTETVATEIFYRIGLYETVPLYFLPVITNRNQETVRAGSVVVVVQGTTTDNPGGTVIIDPNSTFSIFDNLFTYSDTFHTRHTDHNQNDEVITGFVGDMVYTHGSNDYSYFYTLQDHNLTKHYFKTLGTHTDNTINDTVINTAFDTTAYIEAFQKKLLEPHVDIHDQKLSFSDLTALNGNGLINNSCESYINGQRVSRIGDLYYPLDENGNHKTLSLNGETYDICYRLMPPEAWNSPYVLCAKQRQVVTTSETGTFAQGPGVKTQTTLKYFLLNNNSQITNCFIEESSTEIKYQYWTDGPHNETKAYIENNGVKYTLHCDNGTFTYGDSYLPVSTLLEPNVDLSSPIQQSSITSVSHSGGDSNVFHASKYFVQGNVQNLEIAIDSELSGDTPIYVIANSDIELVKITGNASNNRPLILVYLGSGNIQFTSYTGQHFKGTIYAPYATIKPLKLDTGGQTFSGSIITKNLDIEGTEKKSTFEQVNYLRDDVDVKAVADVIKDSMINASQQLTDTYLQQLADSFNGLSYTEGENGPTHTLSVTKDNLADMNWYNNLSYWEKQGLYNKWKVLYENETDPNKKNLLWLWSDVFKKNESSSEGGSSETTAETLRLINFRTEYQPKDNGSEHVVDPFTLVTLKKPNSY